MLLVLLGQELLTIRPANALESTAGSLLNWWEGWKGGREGDEISARLVEKRRSCSERCTIAVFE